MAKNMTNIIVDIANFIINPEISGFLLFLKIFFLSLSVIALIFIIAVAFFRTDWFNWWILWDLKEFLTYRPYGVGKVTKKWAKTKKRLETGSESEYKQAIIEADGLLNSSLKNLRIGLETLEESLRKRLGPDTISNIEKVKEAHQVRNNIVSDPDFRLSLEQTKEVLEIYEKALKDLSML